MLGMLISERICANDFVLEKLRITERKIKMIDFCLNITATLSYYVINSPEANKLIEQIVNSKNLTQNLRFVLFKICNKFSTKYTFLFKIRIRCGHFRSDFF